MPAVSTAVDRGRTVTTGAAHFANRATRVTACGWSEFGSVYWSSLTPAVSTAVNRGRATTNGASTNRATQVTAET